MTVISSDDGMTWDDDRTIMRPYFGPAEISAADPLVTQRQLDPDAAVQRAVNQRIEYLQDIAATTWRERDLFTAGATDFERRREQRRRSALAAELRDLRRAR